VGVLAPIAWRVPPRHYGPWEQFASLLTEGLVKRGVEVTLFATADSLTRARLVGTAPAGYAEDPTLDAKVWEALHIATVFERAGEFDLIHNSFDFLPLSFSRLVDAPVVTTIHGFSSERIVPVFERYADVGHYVAISDADRHPRLDYAATIHHGIEMADFEPGTGHGGYLLFFGRIHPDKGTAEAIEVAERSGVPLVIAGIVQDHAYFDDRCSMTRPAGSARCCPTRSCVRSFPGSASATSTTSSSSRAPYCCPTARSTSPMVRPTAASAPPAWRRASFNRHCTQASEKADRQARGARPQDDEPEVSCRGARSRSRRRRWPSRRSSPAGRSAGGRAGLLGPSGRRRRECGRK
jgi:hypothetical protein